MADGPITFLDAVAPLLSRRRPPFDLPAGTVSAYEGVGATIEAGYGHTVEELDDALAPRWFLQRMFDDPRPAGFAEVAVIAEQVAVLDERLRAACRTDVVRRDADQDWWARLVPLRIEGELIADLGRPGAVRPGVAWPVDEG